MIPTRRDLFPLLAGALSVPGTPAPARAEKRQPLPFLRGINLVGSNRYVAADTWPTPQGLDYWLGLGMNAFRITTMWEVHQKRLMGPLDEKTLAGLVRTVEHLTSRGAYAIVEFHNSTRYKTSGRDADPGSIVGESAVTIPMFADVWAKMAEVFRGNDKVVFEPTNEPHDQSTTVLVDTYNAVIAAIRSTGARNLILLDGNGYSTAASWVRPYDTSVPNGVAMLNIVDPADHFAFSPHQYLDDQGGKLETCVPGSGSRHLGEVTRWARANGRNLLLGEFGGGENATCHAEMARMIEFVEANRDVWFGWLYFGAFAGQRPYVEPDTFWHGIDPADFARPVDTGRTAVLKRFLKPAR